MMYEDSESTDPLCETFLPIMRGYKSLEANTKKIYTLLGSDNLTREDEGRIHAYAIALLEELNSYDPSIDVSDFMPEVAGMLRRINMLGSNSNYSLLVDELAEKRERAGYKDQAEKIRKAFLRH